MTTSSMHTTQFLRAGEAAYLSPASGTLWVTREGDPDDHVLQPGQRLAVARGDRLTLGPWQRDQPALWDWTPRETAPRYRWRFVRDGVAAVFGATARGLRAGADALAALARSAASIARRAQGCIACGESIASAGTAR
jgi:hypothetical protein